MRVVHLTRRKRDAFEDGYQFVFLMMIGGDITPWAILITFAPQNYN